jgi:mono/diheme cytochrome c family protein
VLALAVGLVAAAPAGQAQAPPASATTAQGSFERNVQPVLLETCAVCHNERTTTAGLNIAQFVRAESLVSERDGWERIVAKLRAGEMPPRPLKPLPPAQLAALLEYVQAEFDRADRNLKPDPGRVPIHRLNRAEYANTIRDLVGVDFRASEEFPADDSGYGFDNIGDILTVSPMLMEKYMAAAERIAARAVGGSPLPSPGIFTRRNRVRNIGDGTVELTEVLNYDADYTIRVGLSGHRGDDDKPVTLVISVDGTPVKTVTVPVQLSEVNRQGGATQRALHEARVFLAGNEHVIRAEFAGDEDLKKIPEGARRDVKVNIFPEFIEIAGPYPPAEPRPVRRKFLVCDPASGVACVDRILSGLTRRAYRRSVTRAEVAQVMKVYTRARASGYTPAEGLQFAIASILVSPQFLFRIERDPGPGRIAQVSDVELASRLSYFLWSSMPDDELLDLGAANRLHLPEVLEAQVKRMIADPKAAALSDNFAGQWLETRSLDAMAPDRTRFPEWNNDLKEAMRTETRLFFDAVLRENRPLSDFIDAKYTFLNARLAKHYGIAGVEGPDFRRVELTTDQRSGVLTHGSILTVSSYPTRTSVVLRGKYVLENVLNSPPPPPPADVPALDDAPVGVARSLREQTERHRAEALCASCHTKMDPLGFALENYDAVGKWRSEDGKVPLDVSGALPNGRTFAGPVELKALLKESMPAFTRSVSEKMLTYAIRRGVESHDRLVVRDLVQQTTAADYRIQALIQGIVKSVPFQQRRGTDKPAQEARR